VGCALRGALSRGRRVEMKQILRFAQDDNLILLTEQDDKSLLPDDNKVLRLEEKNNGLQR
jgi:hypothetical protein